MRQSSCPSTKGDKPNNVRNGLKHVETHEHAGKSPVDAVD